MKTQNSDKDFRAIRMAAERQDESVDMVHALQVLWESRKWIAAFTAAFVVGGAIFAILATPVYYSQAIIALKDSGKGGAGAGLFSQLGGMGSVVAAQLGMGNTSLEKLEIILKGHELAEAVIVKNDLLPALYPKQWDAIKEAWKSDVPAKIPTVRKGVEKMRREILAVNLEIKKNIITLGVNMPDSISAKRIADCYLIALNERIRSDVMQDAVANREYLEQQIQNSGDPALVEKIQNMIASEIEKYMLVSNNAFEVLERPVVPFQRKRPNRRVIVMVAALGGLLISILGVFGWRSLAALREEMRAAKKLGEAI
jgi:uncharacterized protein involved in exopolysaccharide biosynthesis